MDGYLVLLRHIDEDLPVKLCDDRDEALRECARIGGDENDGMPSKKIRKIFNTDCSEPINVCVVKFVGGNPVEVFGQIEFV